MIPRCIRAGGKACVTHKDGKYVKWSCGIVYSAEERHALFVKNKKPCKCGQLIGHYSEMCWDCRGKVNGEKRRGMKLPEKWRRAISEGQSGEKGNNWKGTEAGYSSIHKFIRRKFGNPPRCEWCDVEGVRPNGKWTIQWASRDGSYRRDREYWLGLCSKCHSKQETTLDYKRLNITS